MKTITIAFDIDGTLRCNCTDMCMDTNPDVVELARLFKRMKNTSLMAWSGGGKKYVQDFIHTNEVLSAIFKDKDCYSKLEFDPNEWQPDIAIDDQHEFAMGNVNLIVRTK